MQNVETYVERNFEIIYVSLDLANEQYEEHLLELGNWMSIPFGDKRNKDLKEIFKINSIPQVILFSGKSGKMLHRNARQEIFLNSDSDEKMDELFRKYLAQA